MMLPDRENLRAMPLRLSVTHSLLVDDSKSKNILNATAFVLYENFVVSELGENCRIS